MSRVSERFPVLHLVLVFCLLAGLAGLAAPDARGGVLPGGDAESDSVKSVAFAGEVPGSGNGRIHILPTISAVSLKNGDRATIQAIVKASAGVASVTARIEREDGNAGGDACPADLCVASFGLSPAPMNLGGINDGATIGMWQTEWTAHGLEEAYYRVAITVADGEGHIYTDRSLRFSDPIAGNNSIGTTDYPNGGMLPMEDVTFLGSENQLISAVMDAANGYAYFGTRTSPGRVVKVALGDGDTPPARIGAVTLDTGENNLSSAVMDAANGYAYFGTDTSPGRVVKVALGDGDAPPARVGAVRLASIENESNLSSAVIDPANGYAYFGTDTSPGRVVKVALGSGDAPPTRVSAVTLASGENSLYSAVIDAANGYAYFGTGTYPGRVVKVVLGDGDAPPTRMGAVTLDTGENRLVCAVMDAANGYVYLGTSTSPGRVVKLALGDGDALPTRIGAVTLASGENNLRSAVMDAANGYAYFGTYTVPGRVVKVALGSSDALPTRVGAVTLDTGENYLTCAVMDAANGYAYFGTYTSPGRMMKVALGSGDAPPTRIGEVTLAVGENGFCCAVMDAANGYAYFGAYTSPGQVVKMALGNGGAPPKRIGSVALETGENSLGSAVIDAANGYAYFGTATSPGQVVKVALGSGEALPTRVGAVTLASGENNLSCAVMDAANGYAYFGAETSPGRVVKVALGSGNAPPTRVGAVTLASGENNLSCAVMDAANGYAYFGTYTSPGRVVKVALGSDDALPTRVGAVTLASNQHFLRCAVIDPANGYAYFGASYALLSLGYVVKVALGSGDAPPTRMGAVTLPSGEYYLFSAVMDAANGYAYFGTGAYTSSPRRVVKVALGNGNASPKRVGAVTLAIGENNFYSAVMDAANGYAYFGTTSSPGRVVRVAVSQKGFVKGTKFNMPEWGVVESVSFYSHAALGNVRLALYDTGANPSLLCQSGVIANTAAGDWLTVPMSSSLEAGDYCLAWQVDTTANVPSYTEGSAGEGMRIPHAWGGFPATLAAGTATEPTPTSDCWSAYITYGRPRTQIYVKADATGANNGSSWTDAYTDLQFALSSASEWRNDIWVAAGTYKPTAGTDRTISFEMKEGVDIYGGFAGTETERDQRDWETNRTILSGDIGAEGVTSDNTYSIVRGADDAALDGFTVTGGRGNSSWGIYRFGGGMHNDGCSPTVANCAFSDNMALYGGGMYNANGSSPMITNCTFNGNSATYYGGGIYNIDSSPAFADCAFTDNRANSLGGGMHNINSPISMTGCAFSANIAHSGGGIYNNRSLLQITGGTFHGNTVSYNGGGIYNFHASPVLTGCIFSGNTAGDSGGAMENRYSSPALTDCVFQGNTAAYYGGGIMNYESTPFVVNSIFSGNTASYNGGGICDNASSLTLTNSTLSNNSVGRQGGGLFHFGSSPTVINSILWGNMAPAGRDVHGSGGAPRFIHSNIRDCGGSGMDWNAGIGIDGGGNIDADSRFVNPANPAGLDGIWRTEDDGWRLQSDSPCIGAASPDAAPETDIFGFARKAVPDIGACEFLVIYVNAHANGVNDGSSWTDAYTDLQQALSTATKWKNEIWVAAGIYKPTSGTDRTISFVMKEDVGIYGGFAGNESNRSQRNWETRPTILSGDIGVEGSVVDNAYTVIRGANNAVLDGFTITAGNADGTGDYRYGAGMYNDGCSPTVIHCTFAQNMVRDYRGGGMYNTNRSSPAVTDCIFSNNTAGYGGGMSNQNQSAPIVTRCTFSGNTGIGGGMHNSAGCAPVITDCRFIGNMSSGYGGGMGNYEASPVVTRCVFSGNWGHQGGGMGNMAGALPVVTNCIFDDNNSSRGGAIYNDESSPRITNAVFTGNRAGYEGGGMYNIGAGASPKLMHCTLSGNSAGGSGGGIYNRAGSALAATNSILWGNAAPLGPESYHQAHATSLFTHCVLRGGLTSWGGQDAFFGTDGGGNQNTNPLFADAEAGNFRLGAGSPCIDAGTAAGAPETDLDGNLRDAAPDLGAYEYPKGDLMVIIEPAKAIFSGAQWRRTGTEAWWNSGETEYAPVGSHVVEFKSVTAWDRPSSVSVTIHKDQTTTATGTYLPRYTLILSASPPDGGSIAASPLPGPDGTYAAGASVTLTAVPSEGWDFAQWNIADIILPFSLLSPPNPVQVLMDKDKFAGGFFTPKTGALQVMLHPQAARDAGAQWRRAGTEIWRNSGYTETAPAGSHTIEFRDVPGWNQPPNAAVVVSEGEITTRSETYIEKSAARRVVISPPEAVEAGAQWRMDSGDWNDSGHTLSGMAPGSCTIEFRDIAGWKKASSQNITMALDETATVIGIYLSWSGIGSIAAWGSNADGQCEIPERNFGFVAAAGGGGHSLGLKSDGSIRAWGRNTGENGQYAGQCDVPEPNGDFAAVSAGEYHSLGLKSDGTIAAWGLNDAGQCEVPVPNGGFVAVSAGARHSLGLKADGSIVAWGDDSLGQCSVPEPNSDFVAISAGWYHNLGLKSDGSIVAWQSNEHGECDPPESPDGFRAVSAGMHHSLGLKMDGSIAAWGDGGGAQNMPPAPNGEFLMIAAGRLHRLALRSDGSISAWGGNTNGQCEVSAPNAGFVSIAGGGYHSLALRINTDLLIRHFYRALLDREPEPGALKDRLTDCLEYMLRYQVDACFVAGEMARILLNSPEYAARHRSREQFLRDCYMAFLWRAPKPGELEAWLDGVWNQGEALTIFRESGEFESLMNEMYPDHRGNPTGNFVTRLYIGAFDRLAEAGGLLYWSDILNRADDKCAAVKSMARVLFTSSEYIQMNQTAEETVVRIYRALMGRFPADDEIAYWAGLLNAHILSLDRMIEIFGDSIEFTLVLRDLFGAAEGRPASAKHWMHYR